MTIRVRRYEPGDRDAVEALNRRLEARDITDRVWPEESAQPSESRGDPLSQEMYVAVERTTVRGGVWLHEHEFCLDGRMQRAGWLKYPVSESLIDRSYGGVPAALIVALTRRQPHLMALGMGSAQSPLARLLVALRWELTEIPFYVAPVRTSRVLRNLPVLARRRVLGTAAALVARSGLASVLGAPLNLARRLRIQVGLRGATALPVATFEGWADDVWARDRHQYGMVARRDPAMLNHMYRDRGSWLTRLRVSRSGRDIGWICTALADLSEKAPHPAFGQLKVGLLADGFGDPSDAASILGLGMRYLEAAGADLVFSNQSHTQWRSAIRSMGFVRARSNFLLASSSAMSALMGNAAVRERVHVNRGDCDGPRWW